MGRRAGQHTSTKFKMFLNRNLKQRMPKNPLKEIANKRRELP